jgi:GNAT superfamily N-acetyltransferase
LKLARAKNPQRFTFTESDKQGVVCCVELILLPDLFGKRPAAYIHKVYTDERSQGKGKATALINKAIAMARKEGCYKVFTICKNDETAKFYERFGMIRDQLGLTLRLS